MEKIIRFFDMTVVVRCKDCRWWHESETINGYGDCGQANGITLKPSNWFCADGEKTNEFIDKCYICDHCSSFGSPDNEQYKCVQTNRIIENCETIPEWCPFINIKGRE